jgi:hypothetical protein
VDIAFPFGLEIIGRQWLRAEAEGSLFARPASEDGSRKEAGRAFRDGLAALHRAGEIDADWVGRQ